MEFTTFFTEQSQDLEVTATGTNQLGITFNGKTK